MGALSRFWWRSATPWGKQNMGSSFCGRGKSSYVSSGGKHSSVCASYGTSHSPACGPWRYAR